MFDWRLWRSVYLAYSPGVFVVLVVDLSLPGLQKQEYDLMWLPSKVCNLVTVLYHLLCT